MTQREEEKQWKQKEEKNSDAFKFFFGLRDFYNLIKTFSDLILPNEEFLKKSMA